MVQETSPVRRRSNAYDVFILNLTLISLVVMEAMLLPLAPQPSDCSGWATTFVFVIDFFHRLWKAPRNALLLSVSQGKGRCCFRDHDGLMFEHQTNLTLLEVVV